MTQLVANSDEGRAKRPSVHKLTDRRLVEELLLVHGLRYIAKVPCSISRSLEAIVERAADQYGDPIFDDSRLRYPGKKPNVSVVRTTHEANLPGIAAGLALGSNELVAMLSQNSGIWNLGDGALTCLSENVNDVGVLYLETWRGHDPSDNSEPHQAIGRICKPLTRLLFPGATHGRLTYSEGRTLSDDLDSAVAHVKSGRMAALLLSPAAFDVTHEPQPRETSVGVSRERYDAIRDAYARTSYEKGTFTPKNPFRSDVVVDRDAAIREIIDVYERKYEDPFYVVGNGFNSRAFLAAFGDNPRALLLAGYMGGASAVAYGLALARPDRVFIVVEGDQNAQMSHMRDHYEEAYPPNVEKVLLNNGGGASIGGTLSLALALGYYDHYRVIPTRMDSFRGFKHPRIESSAERTRRFRKALEWSRAPYSPAGRVACG